MKKLSIIVPCYNEQESLPLFYPAVKKIIKKIPVKPEYIFVNDGSSDDTLKELKKSNKKIRNTFTTFLFRETLVKRRPFMPVCKPQLVTWWS